MTARPRKNRVKVADKEGTGIFCVSPDGEDIGRPSWIDLHSRYDIWAMKMEHYLSHTDYPIWEVIQKGNGHVSVSTDTNGVIKVLPPKITKEILARERERKARTTLLMALPEDHLAKFHKMTDAKDMWDAIKSRFGGNDESKKMQKYILKQQFESFSVSPLKMPIRSSLGLYLLPGPKVFESDIKGSTGSSSSAQNVGFISFESTSSTNDVSNAYGVSTSSGYNSQRENSSSTLINSCTHSLLINPVGESCILMPRNQLDLTRLKSNATIVHKTWHFARECRSKGNQESKRRDARNTGYKEKDNERRPGKQEEPKTLVTLDGEGVDWTGHAEDEQENFALIAYSNSGSNTEVKSCSKECVESYAKLKKVYDKQREQLGDASIEIQAYTQALKKLGYGNQIHEGVLSYENKVFQSVFDSRSSDVKDSPVHDRFANVKGMHAVLPPMTGNYIPPGPNREVDDSMFTYGPKQSKTSEYDTQTSNFDSRESNSSVETLESVPEPVVVEPKVVSQPKVWPDAPIIEEYESDSDDEYVIQPSKERERSSFAFIDTVKHVKPPRETKRMAKQVELNKKKGKGTGQGKNRLVWNNVQRLNHQNKFVPTSVLTRTGRIPVNTARQNLSSQAATTSIARKVNSTRPIVNEIRPRNNFYKSHLPIRRPFNRTTAPRTNFSNHKVNIAGVKAVSVVGGIRETVVKPSTCCNWRPKRHYWNKVSKYNGGSNSRKYVNSEDPLGRHKPKMAGAYLAEYQDYNGGPVAFGDKLAGQNLVLPGLVGDAQKCFTMVLMLALGQRCSLD
ncbi:hypothetical protein Tco_1131392 [Tanacetum coccineum]